MLHFIPDTKGSFEGAKGLGLSKQTSLAFEERSVGGMGKENCLVKPCLGLFRQGELICVYSTLMSTSCEECSCNLLQRHRAPARIPCWPICLKCQVKYGLGAVLFEKQHLGDQSLINAAPPSSSSPSWPCPEKSQASRGLPCLSSLSKPNCVPAFLWILQLRLR